MTFPASPRPPHSPELLILMPIYNDWEAVALLLDRLDTVLGEAHLEAHVLLVDDGSATTYGWRAATSRAIPRVDVLTLRRNLGHQRAIAIGLAYAFEHLHPRAVVVMDGDGEDTPEDVVRLVQAATKDPRRPVVFAERRRRSESYLFHLFYAFYRYAHRLLTGIPVRVGKFSLLPDVQLSRLVVVSELWSHYAAAVFKARLPRKTIPTTRGQRLAGRPRMGFIGLVGHGLSALAVHAEVIGVRLLIVAGVAIAIVGGLLAGVVGIRALTSLAIPGWATSAAGLLAVLLFQMLFFAALFAFLVMHARSQPLFLPVRDYHHFVGGVTTWAARRVLQTSAFTYVGSELELFKEATHWKRYYAKQLRPFITGDVLEVGAGIGATTRVLCHGEENSWTCLEPDGAMTERLRASLTTDPLPVEARAVCGTLADLGTTEQFDTLLYIDVLEHIEDDRAELVAASGRLKPGGHLIVLAPAHNWLFSAFDRAIGHFRRYSKASLLAAAPPELRLVRAFYLDSVGMMASAANRAFLKASSPTRRQIRLWDSAFVPTSRVVDSLLAHRVGKTVVAIWTLPRAAERAPYLRAESA